MIPWKTLATAGHFTLKARGGEYLIQVDGKVLIGSRQTGSEVALAAVGCRGLPGPAPRVLIGGLGFGYTLRAALQRLPPGAKVTVAEISAAIAEWNRGVLALLADAPLDDERVTLVVGDVAAQLKPASWDAILLDVDNGPFAVAAKSNQALYTVKGLRRFHGALAPRGQLVVWSASADGAFEKRLEEAAFKVEAKPEGSHVLYLAHRR
jgi:spermidine synthase